MSQLQSQILGILLAIITALGCISYEKLVKNFSFGIIILLATLFYVPVLVGMFLYSKGTLGAEVVKLVHDRTFLMYAAFYVLTWITVPLWYVITKNQGVLVSSIYEVKYIVVLAIFYLLWGDRNITVYTAAGLVCALMSIYFISK
jgi:hypothetical protein